MTLLIESAGLVGGALAVAGVLMNNRKMRACFIVWTISNSLSLAIHLYAGPYTLAARDLIFLILALEGWKLWGRKDMP